MELKGITIEDRIWDCGEEKEGAGGILLSYLAYDDIDVEKIASISVVYQQLVEANGYRKKPDIEH